MKGQKTMKKIITTALIAAMLTATLAGCSNNANSGNSGTNSDASNITSDTDSNPSGDASNTESGEDSTPVAEAKSPVERLNAVFSEFECFSPNGGMPMIVAGADKAAIEAVFPTPADPEKRTHCVSMIGEDVANTAQWFGATELNLDDCEDYVFAGPMISASLKQIVIVKPKAGREEAVKSAMTAFAEYAKTPNPIEYPAWEAERAGTKFGETSDGCFYVVVAKEGAEMGAAIENA
ncbi:MAG: hypothetical protein ACI4JS_03570 [Oscillospiraceae bacterium]